MSQTDPASKPRPTASHAPQETHQAASKRKPLLVTDDSNEPEEGKRFFFFNALPSWMVSFMAHVAIIILLAIIALPGPPTDPTVALEASDSTTAMDDSLDVNLDVNLDDDLLETDDLITDPLPTISEMFETPTMQENVDFGDFFADSFAVESDIMSEATNMDTSSEVSSRSDSRRQEMLRKYGGNAASEEAVKLALKWIIAHQLEDGGWSFDHQRGLDSHRTSPDPGSLGEARNGATAIALLPLLGAGQTHLNGEYRSEIEKGLAFLMRNGKQAGRGISFWEDGGTMYSHGLAAIVFNEAYAMTEDPALAQFAQRTIYFIEDSQDPVGGGWRYRPRERGDTSVVGWQLMALKSGFATGMKFRNQTLRLIEKFLDSVSSSGGAFYGYMDKPPADRKPADGRTAIGLLCRMYLGWSKEAPGLIDGVNAISDRGPKMNRELDVYYNYYATQLMKHYGGSTWNKWNVTMRDYLVDTQVKTGPGAGSWTPGSQHGDGKGGRLYATALSCMTLEVYYRFLPLYDEQIMATEFKLD